jgi:hypothetical protein
MLMSHNSSDQEIEFFLSFLYNAIKGDERYNSFVINLLEDAKSLASGKSVYELDKTSLNLKILIDRFAHDWLLKVDVSKPSTEELKQLQDIISDNKNYAIA